ncbi:HK97 family phage prohead protease [Paenibacillus barcinonensis]|uniref:HK97 family phage prohead protease n=1 Tax=Paenibacillus barcinonensis TaxID=198119 RepID=A0A2V4UPG7_PAEBA|nr:HK97 family phage prohead protease [Paenibacillus barcinonensis]PYE42127.1 hypothetical protein DFQ00_14224 [Paenibacillus barcinonensis]QKS57200.1 HK97 family phage prohead protease [Paenibacillus barcinonensis]
MRKETQQKRGQHMKLSTRSEKNGQEMTIEGYFALYNTETELWQGAYEEIATGAFDGTLSNDVRALVNHDTTLVLGRNKAGTLELKTDPKGLWGKIKINPSDADAVSLYERVKRGDVDQCSFGFNILEEDTDYRNDGSVKWTIRKIDLHEVSVCTFPAYQATGIQARKSSIYKRPENLEERKVMLREKLEFIRRDSKRMQSESNRREKY